MSGAGDVMTLRITLTDQGPPAVLALAGRLTGEEIAVMSRTVAEARDEVILDLTWLQAADREGLKLLRELKAQGMGFVGVSPYMLGHGSLQGAGLRPV